MKYVLAHTPIADDWIYKYPRLYAYPKSPNTHGEELVLLDSGAFGLSLIGKRIDESHMEKLAQHYNQHTGNNVVPIAPDEFLNPDRSMSNFRQWHVKHKIPVAPVLQVRKTHQFDAMGIHRQLAFYKQYPLARFNGKQFICFSNAGWRGIEFAPYAQALRIAIRLNFPAGIWLHNLGAGWEPKDIQHWMSFDLFNSIDSIAWHTDAANGKSWVKSYDTDLYHVNAMAGTNAAKSNKQ